MEARHVNECKFVGYLGSDIDIKYLDSGTAVGKTSLAVTERWKKNGEKKEKTVWVPLKIWGKTAEYAIENGVVKGSRVFVSGKFDTEEWDGEHGKVRRNFVNAFLILKIEKPPPRDVGSKSGTEEEDVPY